MIQGKIEAISLKNSSLLLNGNWHKVDGLALPFAKKGTAEIDFTGDKITHIKMLVNDVTSNYPKANFEKKPFDENREKKIIRQSCLKCAVDLACVGKIEITGLLEYAAALEEWVNR